MRIGIVGTGAMASFLAAKLSTTAATVVLVGRWQAHVKAIVDHGLIYHDIDGTKTVMSVDATTEWETLETVDIVIVLTKTYQFSSALMRANAIASPSSPIILMWNGVSDDHAFEEAFPNRVTHAILLAGSLIDQPGSVRFTGGNTIQFAMPIGKESLFMPLVTILRTSGIDVALSSDQHSLRWSKVVINAAINPLTALLRKPNGFLAIDEEARLLMTTAAQEAAAVVMAMGIPLSFDDAAAEALRIAQLSAANHSSMYSDVAQGRPTEIDAILYPLLVEAKKHHIDTPMLKGLYDALTNNQSANEIKARPLSYQQLG